MSAREVYSEAKRVLVPSAPERVVCRDGERAELLSHLLPCFEDNKAISLYVNGQPGTGKTLLTTSLLEELEKEYTFKKIFLNCMSLTNAQSLYKIMENELTGKKDSVSTTPSKRSNKENKAKSVEKIVTTLKYPVVLLLDEVDQIETALKGSRDLYNIFEWPYLTNSKLILIGIANSLDFNDRFLPRLELKPEWKPRIVKFMPYSREAITSIVKDRLASMSINVDQLPVIDDKAITFCASKVASSNGDIRKVLDICRRAIEIVEQDLKQANQPDAFKTVTIVHMMKVFNEVNPMANASLNRNTMPLMQKILLCTILLCTKETQMREVTVSKLFDKFNKICKAKSTEIESESEFLNLIAMVQDNGLVEMKKAKEIRSGKIHLKIDEQELKDRLQDETFMADILTNPIYK